MRATREWADRGDRGDLAEKTDRERRERRDRGDAGRDRAGRDRDGDRTERERGDKTAARDDSATAAVAPEPRDVFVPSTLIGSLLLLCLGFNCQTHRSRAPYADVCAARRRD